MKVKAGVWIDRTRAVIVFVDERNENIITLESNISRHVRPAEAGNSGNPNGRRDLTPDDIKEREFAEHLTVFYKKVASQLRNAETILVFGPGEPKHEFAKLMEQGNLRGRIVSIETVDKLTDRQVAARVRDHFYGRAAV
jgi:hypothetical protein